MGDWNLAKRVINESKIRWTIGTIKPLTSAGTDGIVPVLFQQGAEHVVPHLCRIPEPGKLDYTEAKAYRPISLSSFF
jgi:hypothetical protein